MTSIVTRHFGGRPMPITTVLSALAAQEGNDGDEGNVMQAAADEIYRLRELLADAFGPVVAWASTYQREHQLAEFHPSHAELIARFKEEDHG